MDYKFSVDSKDPEYSVIMNFKAETINEVVENFELFLRGVGFHPDCIKEELGREL